MRNDRVRPIAAVDLRAVDGCNTAMAVIQPTAVNWRYRPMLLKTSLEGARLAAMLKQGIREGATAMMGQRTGGQKPLFLGFYDRSRTRAAARRPFLRS